MPDYPLSRQALHDRLRAGAKNTWSDWLDVRAEGGKATLRIHDVIGDYWAETTSGDIAVAFPQGAHRDPRRRHRRLHRIRDRAGRR